MKMNREIPYVCGFAFSRDLESLILIQKKRGPSFNVGRWNGIGGKIEPGEGPRGAMAREFKEETGLETVPEQWATFHIEKHLARAEQTKDPRIYYMTTLLDKHQLRAAVTAEDEPVKVFNFFLHPLSDVVSDGVYNLEFLFDMARCWHRNPEHRWIEG